MGWFGQKGSEQISGYDTGAPLDNLASLLSPELLESMRTDNLYKTPGKAVFRQKSLGSRRLRGSSGVPDRVAAARNLRRTTNTVLEQLTREVRTRNSKKDIEGITQIMGAMTQESRIMAGYAQGRSKNRFEVEAGKSRQRTQEYLSRKRALYGAIGAVASTALNIGAGPAFGFLGSKIGSLFKPTESIGGVTGWSAGGGMPQIPTGLKWNFMED